MMYNREEYRKLREKKILHKKGKRWIVISLALLGMIGAGSTNFEASASTTPARPQGTSTQRNANVGQNQATQPVQHSAAQAQVSTPHSASQRTVNPNNIANKPNINNNAAQTNPTVQHPVQPSNRAQKPIYQSRNYTPQAARVTQPVKRNNINRTNPSTQQALNRQRPAARIVRPAISRQAANNAQQQQQPAVNREQSAQNIHQAQQTTVQPRTNTNRQIAQQPLTRHISQSAFNQAHPTIHKAANHSAMSAPSNESQSQSASQSAEQILHDLDHMSAQIKNAATNTDTQAKTPHLITLQKLSSSVNVLQNDHATMSTESSQSSALSNDNSTNMASVGKMLNNNTWGKAPSSATSQGSQKSMDLASILNTNAWSSMTTSASNAADSNVNSVAFSSGQLGTTATDNQGRSKHLLGFVPYSADPNNISGVVSDAMSDASETSQIATAKGGYYAPSYANMAESYLSNMNELVSDYNDLLPGPDYWQNLGQSDKASSVASALSAGNLQTDHNDIMNYDADIAAEDSQANDLISNPNTVDTIQFVDNGKEVGSTNINGKKNTQTTISNNIPSGYRLANDGTQTITFTGGTHMVDVLPMEDTDTINYMYNGKKIGTTTMQGGHETRVTADGSNMPQGYRLAGDSTNSFVLDNAEHNVDVIPITMPQQSTITVVFTDQAGHHISKDVTGTSGQSGADITSLAPVPSGYTLNAGQNTSYSFQNNPTSVNLQIMGITQHFTVNVQINKFDKNNALIGTEHATAPVTGRTGDKYTIDPNNFTPSGFQSESNPMSGSITDSGITDNTASFNYTQENSSPITVLYFDQNGKQIATNTLNGLYGQTGQVTTAPTGYQIKPGTDTGYTFTNSPQTIQIELEGNSATSLPGNGEMRVMVEKMEDGRIQNDTPEYVPVNGLVGDSYTIDPAKMAPVGYTSISEPVSGTITPNGLSNPDAKFVYVSDNSSTIAVNYINQVGNNIGHGFMSGMAGNYANVTDPRQGGISVPAGYTLNDGQNTIYQFQKGVKVVNLHVFGGNNSNYDYNLQVVLRRPDGNGGWTTNGMFSKSINIPESGVVGNTFSIDPSDPQITQQIPNYSQNFEPDSEDANVSGSIENGHLSQNGGTYYYNLTPGAEGGPVTVHYIHNGQPIDTEVFNGAPDQYLNLLGRIPANYQAINASNYDSVMIGTQPQTINIDLDADTDHNTTNNSNNSSASAATSQANNSNTQPASTTSTTSASSSTNTNNTSASTSSSAGSHASQPSSETNSSNESSTSSNGTNEGSITINYTNANTGLVIKPLTVTGDNGSLLDLRFYKDLVPDGYYIQSVPEPVGAFTDGNQTMRVNILPIGTTYGNAIGNNSANSNMPVSNTVQSSSASSTSPVQSVSSNTSTTTSNTVPLSSNTDQSNSQVNSVSNMDNTNTMNYSSSEDSYVDEVDAIINGIAQQATGDYGFNGTDDDTGYGNYNEYDDNYNDTAIPTDLDEPLSAHMSDAKRNYLNGEQDALALAKTDGDLVAKGRVDELTPLVSKSYIRGYRKALGMPNPISHHKRSNRKGGHGHGKGHAHRKYSSRPYSYRKGGRKRRSKRNGYSKRYNYTPRHRHSRKSNKYKYYTPKKTRRTSTAKSKKNDADKTNQTSKNKAKGKKAKKHSSASSDAEPSDLGNDSLTYVTPVTSKADQTQYEKGYTAASNDIKKTNTKQTNKNSHTIRYDVPKAYLYGYLSSLNTNSQGSYPTADSWNDGFLSGCSEEDLDNGDRKAAEANLERDSTDRGHKAYVKGYHYALGYDDKSDSTSKDSSDMSPFVADTDTSASDQGVPNISDQNKASESRTYKNGITDFDNYAQSHTMKDANKQSHSIRYNVPKQYLFGYIDELAADSNGRYPNKNTWNQGFYDGAWLKTNGVAPKDMAQYAQTAPSRAYQKGFKYATGMTYPQSTGNNYANYSDTASSSEADNPSDVPSDTSSNSSENPSDDTNSDAYLASLTSEIANGSAGSAKSTTVSSASSSDDELNPDNDSDNGSYSQPTYYEGNRQDGYDDTRSIIRENGWNTQQGLNAAKQYISDLQNGNINTNKGNSYNEPANSAYINGSIQALNDAKNNYNTSHAGAYKADGYNYVRSLIANSGIAAARQYVNSLQPGSQQVSGIQATSSYMSGCQQALSNYDQSEAR